MVKFQNYFRIEAGMKDSLLSDIYNSILTIRIIFSLSMMDLKRRYRKTALGPVWGILNAVLFSFVIGYIYSDLLDQELIGYILYVYFGYMVWIFISETLGAGSEVFIREYGVISQSNCNYFSLVLKHALTRFLILLHNFPIVLILLILSRIPSIAEMLLIFFGLLVLIVNSSMYSVYSSILNSRFRDYSHIVSNFTRFLFFATPIVWIPDTLSDGLKSFIVQFNPFYYFIEIIRSPVLGKTLPDNTILIIMLITFINMLVGGLAYRYYKKSVVFWVGQ